MERTDACAGSLHFLQINILKLSENKKNFYLKINSLILPLISKFWVVNHRPGYVTQNYKKAPEKRLLFRGHFYFA